LDRAIETVDQVASWISEDDGQAASVLRAAATDIRDLRVELEMEAIRTWRLVPA
jgi:hypothetical protein